LFTVSKILSPLADPRSLAFLVLALGVLLLWTPWRRFGRLLATLAVLVAAVLIAVPAGEWLLKPIEARFSRPLTMPEKVDGIVVLGGDFDAKLATERGPLSPGRNGAPRLMAAADLARHYPNAKIVFAGGSGNLFDQQTREADIAAKILLTLGVDLSRVVFDRNSRNTYENALNAFRLVLPKPDETWVLVTSASHMPRAVGCFRRIDWNILPYPVDYWTHVDPPGPGQLRFDGGMRVLERAMREWIGLGAYYMMGRTDALFPKP
jgi:uncharacterized SAM-binding protein YcdF (DUF218 family)